MCKKVKKENASEHFGARLLFWNLSVVITDKLIFITDKLKIITLKIKIIIVTSHSTIIFLNDINK